MEHLYIKNFKHLNMNKIITSLVVALAMTSCDKKSVLDDYYAEITDKDLREAIIEYDDSLKKKNVKTPYFIVPIQTRDLHHFARHLDLQRYHVLRENHLFFDLLHT